MCEELIAAHTKFNNMIEDKTWRKVDPCDARIMALTTKLEQLEMTRPAAIKPAAGRNEVHIADWRKKFDCEKKDMEEKTWHLCKQHKTKDDYDGLYVSLHTPKTHDKWEKNKKVCKAKSKGKAVDSSASEGATK